MMGGGMMGMVHMLVGQNQQMFEALKRSMGNSCFCFGSGGGFREF
jgi:hypothetical protein